VSTEIPADLAKRDHVIQDISILTPRVRTIRVVWVCCA